MLIKLKIFISLICVIFMVKINADNIMIAESSQSTATERNNARLIVEDQVGILHVVFYDNGIFHSLSSDNGQSWISPPIMITEIGRNPSIALDHDNLLHLVYKKGGISANDIVHRTYSNGAWSEEDTVHQDAITTVSRPVIAIDNENNLHCVWQRAGFSTTPNSEIWYKKCTQGSGWSSLTNISNTFGASEYPTLAIDNDNNIYTFWKDSGENVSNDKMVLFRKYTVGTGWDENYTNVSNTTGNGSSATMDPCAIVDTEKNVHLVWKDSFSGTSEIYYKKNTNGIWDTLPTNISNQTNASGRPSISIDSSDNLYVVWENKTDGIYFDVVYKMYEKNSDTWSNLGNISNTYLCDSRHPISPIITKDYLHAIWTEGENAPYSIMINSAFLVDSNDIIVNDTDYLLEQNYPNPFNPSTTISFSIATNDYENAQIIIYNVKGQKVRQFKINHSKFNINEIVWDGKNEQNEAVSSGIYFYQLMIKEKVQDVKKCLLIK